MVKGASWGATLGLMSSLQRDTRPSNPGIEHGIRSQTCGNTGARGWRSGPGTLGCARIGSTSPRRRPPAGRRARVMSVSDADVERIAARVAELVGDARPADEPEWVAADAIAKNIRGVTGVGLCERGRARRAAHRARSERADQIRSATGPRADRSYWHPSSRSRPTALQTGAAIG